MLWFHRIVSVEGFCCFVKYDGLLDFGEQVILSDQVTPLVRWSLLVQSTVDPGADCRVKSTPMSGRLDQILENKDYKVDNTPQVLLKEG